MTSPINALEQIAKGLTGLVDDLRDEMRHLERELRLAELDVEASPPPEPGPVDGMPAHNRIRAALATAEFEWLRQVQEPPGPGWQRIDDYIRGLTGLHWTWEKPYKHNRQFAWCGAFAAYCYGKAGLSASIRRDVMPSCYRLQRWANDTVRMIKPPQILPGDVVVVGPDSGKRWGAHITICTGIVGSVHIETIEGNAKGEGVEGQRYEGVVKGIRPFTASRDVYRVRYGVRFVEEDFE